MAETSQAPTTTPIPQPEKLTSVKGIFDLWWKKQALGFESCLPAMFLGYVNDDRSTGMAWIQPLVNKKLTSGETIERGSITLPIHHIQHGTFMVDVPLVKGDTGWIIAGDRENMATLDENAQIQAADSDIGRKDEQGNSLGNSGPQPPAVNDTHRYLYGFFLPDKWGGIPLPPEMKDSLVIGQVNPDATSHGRFVMDPDGTIHILSTRWYDAKKQELRGGAVYVDLSWKDEDTERTPLSEILKQIKADNDSETGNYILRARETVLGDLNVKEDPDSKSDGGNLAVQHGAEVGGGLKVGGKAEVGGGLSVNGDSLMNGKVTVKDNSSRTATIDANDLKQGDARFVLKKIVTGQDVNQSTSRKVVLTVQDAYVLADDGVDADPIEIPVGDGGSVKTDQISVKWHQNGVEEEIAVKGWHNQQDINGDGSLPTGETPEAGNDPEGAGGDLSLEAMIIEGRGEKYKGYQVVARKSPGGPLVYIPIASISSSGDSSSDEPGSSSSEDPGSSSSEEPGSSSSEDSGDSGDSGDSSGEPPGGESEPVVIKVDYNKDPNNRHSLRYQDGTINLATGIITPGQWHDITTAIPCDCHGGGSEEPGEYRGVEYVRMDEVSSGEYDVVIKYTDEVQEETIGTLHDGSDGVGISNITSDAVSSSGYTDTTVTVTLTDNNTKTFKVRAKDGVDGAPGSPGASVTGATAGTPTESGGYTETPITFTLSTGASVGPVNVKAKNGSNASNKYLTVNGNPTDSTGAAIQQQVQYNGTAAKTLNLDGLVTKGTTQTITASKTFTPGQGLYFTAGSTGVHYFLRAGSGSDSDNVSMVDKNGIHRIAIFGDHTNIGAYDLATDFYVLNPNGRLLFTGSPSTKLSISSRTGTTNTERFIVYVPGPSGTDKYVNISAREDNNIALYAVAGDATVRGKKLILQDIVNGGNTTFLEANGSNGTVTIGGDSNKTVNLHTGAAESLPKARPTDAAITVHKIVDANWVDTYYLRKPSGSGGSPQSTSFDFLTSVTWNTSSKTIDIKYRTATFTNGILTNVSSEKTFSPSIATTGISTIIGS